MFKLYVPVMKLPEGNWVQITLTGEAAKKVIDLKRQAHSSLSIILQTSWAHFEPVVTKNNPVWVTNIVQNFKLYRTCKGLPGTYFNSDSGIAYTKTVIAYKWLILPVRKDSKINELIYASWES